VLTTSQILNLTPSSSINKLDVWILDGDDVITSQCKQTFGCALFDNFFKIIAHFKNQSRYAGGFLWCKRHLVSYLSFNVQNLCLSSLREINKPDVVNIFKTWIINDCLVQVLDGGLLSCALNKVWNIRSDNLQTETASTDGFNSLPQFLHCNNLSASDCLIFGQNNGYRYLSPSTHFRTYCNKPYL